MLIDGKSESDQHWLDGREGKVSRRLSIICSLRDQHNFFSVTYYLLGKWKWSVDLKKVKVIIRQRRLLTRIVLFLVDCNSYELSLPLPITVTNKTFRISGNIQRSFKNSNKAIGLDFALCLQWNKIALGYHHVLVDGQSLHFDNHIFLLITTSIFW